VRVANDLIVCARLARPPTATPAVTCGMRYRYLLVVKWVLRPSGTAKTIAPLGASAVETAKHSPNSPEKCRALRPQIHYGAAAASQVNEFLQSHTVFGQFLLADVGDSEEQAPVAFVGV